jgi:hypothetical protein
MKTVFGISAIVLLFGVADASAEERTLGTNLVPSAQINVVYRRRPRFTRYNFPSGRVYRGRSGNDLYIGRGPYPDRLTPGGVLTGPIPRSAKGGG